ncbi:hypothetical protein TanjilG_29743 [Lupinus angustifolius]|uniref:Uncharacterized protein n=1 Tax=Lupinus angustifolius TaxID=3871 RepID=A0A1J7GTG4_LUPAN|nr:hypothetical protein TanjilG_29743 [Lupinus angustifolius]
MYFDLHSIAYRILVSSNTKNGIATASSNGPSVSATLQQAKKYFAATEAQKDGCTGNYRIFDSAFGNFLVPVVPTRAELTKMSAAVLKAANCATCASQRI